MTYQRNKVWKDELTLWEDAIQKSPHKARVYVNRGRALIIQGNFSQAKPDFEKAIKIDPNFAAAYSNLGASNLAEGNILQALADYNRSIEINPKNRRAYYGRATTYYYLKKYDLAWEDVHQLEKLANPVVFEGFQDFVHQLSQKSSFRTRK
jgi:tetratricopeptide (TPR) repeat protein